MNDQDELTTNTDCERSLSDQINDCLLKLDFEEGIQPGNLGAQIPPSTGIKDSTHLVINNCTMSIEQFKDQLKKIIAEGSPMATANEGAPGGFSTTYKNKGMAKSRQISMHTNVYLNTDCGDDLSNKHEMYSTAQTMKQGTKGREVHHARQDSNKQSFFNQTNTTFISIDNTIIPSEIASEAEVSLTEEGEPEIDLALFTQGVQKQLEAFNMSKKTVQKRLVTHEKEIKLRPTLKRKIRAAIEDPADVPMSIFYNFVEYGPTLFKRFLQLSRGMRKHLLFHTFEYIRPLANNLKNFYGGLFDYAGQSISQTPISFGKESGTRVDQVIRLKLKNECKEYAGAMMTLAHSYQLQKLPREEFISQFSFDVFKQLEKRWMWIHNDECLFHGRTDARAYTMPIMPVCVGDYIEISVTLFSLMGVLDVSSVKWLPIEVKSQPPLKDVRDYNRFKNLTPNRDFFQKYFADLNRVCEAEDTVVEWFDVPYIRTTSLSKHIKRHMETSQFERQFDIVKTEVGGIDFSVWRVHMRAKKTPTWEYTFYPEMNVEIRVAPQGEVTNEVKRTGLLIDRGARIEVRPGDEVIVYVSMGGFDK